MKDNKGLTIVLTIVAVLLVVVSGISLALSDFSGPKIAMEQMSLTYVDGEAKEPLLAGVSAYDKKDGDVTASLMIKDITVMNSGDTARVTYAARDKHNNITEAYRVVTYISSEENYSEPEYEETEEIDEIELTEEESTEELEETPVEEEIEEPVQEEQVDEPAPQEEKKEEPKKEEAKKDDDKTPKITLKQKSVNINVGQTFNPSDYIKTKENVSSIEIDGAINVMAPGTYPLTFKVTGPDGKTASETLTVVVK